MPLYITAPFQGCLAYKAASLTGQNLTAGAVVTWDTDAYDTNAFHDTGSNTSRMTVPAGVSYVRLTGYIVLANHTANKYMNIYILKNATSFTGIPSNVTQVNLTGPSMSIVSPVVAVVAGDYFEINCAVETDTSVDIVGGAAGSWFAIEVLA